MTTTTPRQLWFLLDRSGSMAGEKWTKTCLALHDCVAGLSPDDRVFITLFDDRPQHFAEKPLAPAALLVDPRFRTLVALGTGGGTELLPALQEILQHASTHRDAAFRPHLILITDGQVGNEAAIRSALKPHAGHLAVHTIGIDFAVNDSLLQQLAEDNGGRSMFISPSESVSEAVELVLRGSGARALHTLRLGNGLSSARRLPDMLVSGLETTLLITGKTATSSPVLQALTPDASIWTCTPAPLPCDGTVLHLIHARREIDRYQAAGNQPAALALARENNLLCLGASFIAIDRESKVPISTEEHQQPVFAQQSEGIGYTASFGIREVEYQARGQSLEDSNWRSAPPKWTQPTSYDFPLYTDSEYAEKTYLCDQVFKALLADNITLTSSPTELVSIIADWLLDLRSAAEAGIHVARILRTENPGLDQRALQVLFTAAIENARTGSSPQNIELKANYSLIESEARSYTELVAVLGGKTVQAIVLISNYRLYHLEPALLCLPQAPTRHHFRIRFTPHKSPLP